MTDDDFLERNLDDPRIWKDNGNEYFKKGQYEDAIKSYAHAVELDPNYLDAWNNLGLALLKIGRIDEAKRCNKKVIELKKIGVKNNIDESQKKGASTKKEEKIQNKQISPKIDVGVKLYNERKYEEAIKIFDQIISDNPNDYFAYNHRGRSYAKIEKYANAIRDFDKAIELKSDYTDAIFNKGMSLQEKATFQNNAENTLKNALSCYDKIIQINSEDTDAWFYRGMVYYELEKYPDALLNFEKVIDLKPMHTEAYHYKAMVLERMGNDEQSQVFKNKAIKNDAKPITKNKIRILISVIILLGIFTVVPVGFYYTSNNQKVIELNKNGMDSLNRGNYADAISSFEESLKINPNDANIWGQKGFAYLKINEYKQALISLEKSLELNPNDKYVWNNKGVALKHLGRFEEAKEAYQMALEIDPNFETAKKNLNL